MVARRLIPIGAFALLTTGCAVQLAPAYDQSIVTGLVSANTNMYILFSTIGTDADKSTYPTRDSKYNQVIGELNALTLQAKARPLPPEDTVLKVNSKLEEHKITPIDENFSGYPSARSMENTAKTLTTMQTADRVSGLHGNEIAAFENEATIYMTQAVTYENFLKR